MNKETIYIPWFGNKEDAIYENYLWNQWIVLQKNLRNISIETIQKFLDKYWLELAFQKLQKKYHDLKREDFDKAIQSIEDFKWFTRDLNTTVNLTEKEIRNVLEDETKRLKIIWHSQGWLVAMLSIIKNPSLLDKVDAVELMAPVSTFSVGRGFHKWNEWYLNPKKIIVRKEYITSLDQESDVLSDFLNLLKERNYQWEVKLVLWDIDPVIGIQGFELEVLKSMFPFLTIEVVHWDHYLWYKK